MKPTYTMKFSFVMQKMSSAGESRVYKRRQLCD